MGGIWSAGGAILLGPSFLVVAAVALVHPPPPHERTEPRRASCSLDRGCVRDGLLEDLGSPRCIKGPRFGAAHWELA